MGGRPEALVFDFDGVLADTEPLHWKSWAALLLQHGMRIVASSGGGE
jgi:beta-phosphoglucomutase-like phosphatase (HAD superfamily)